MQEYWEKLISQMQAQHDKGFYHLLLGNLKICVALARYEGIEVRAEHREVIKRCGLTVDSKVKECHFRDYLSLDYIRAFEEVFRDKKDLINENFFKELQSKELPSSDLADNYPPLLGLKNLSFQSFLQGDRKDRHKSLREQQSTQVSYLASNPQNARNVGVVKFIIAYWHLLKLKQMLEAASFPILSKNAVGKLVTLGEDVLADIFTDKTRSSEHLLWPCVLMLMQVLDEKIKVENLEVLKNIPQNAHFQIACVLHGIAQYLHSKIAESEVIVWLQNVTILNQNILQEPSTKIRGSLLKDYKSSLEETRGVFYDKSVSIFNAQKQHSSDIIKLLNIFITAVVDILGDPPIDFAFCLLGSTARYDRRPYSDLELLFLYEPHVNTKEEYCHVYILQLMSCVELLVTQLGETPHERASSSAQRYNGGFRFDKSHYILGWKSNSLDENSSLRKLWGTPEEIFKLFTQVEIVEGKHPWISDRTFYALFHPVVINSNYGSGIVFKKYNMLLNDFLDQLPNLQVDKLAEFAKQVSLPVARFNHFKRRHLIAMGSFWEILHKSVTQLNALKEGDTVDLKEVYYKPLCYLAESLKLYSNLVGKHPVDILKEAYPADINIQILLKNALEFVVKQQVKLHLAKKYQEEEMIYRGTLSAESELLWAEFDRIAQRIIFPLQRQFYEQFDKDILCAIASPNSGSAHYSWPTHLVELKKAFYLATICKAVKTKSPSKHNLDMFLEGAVEILDWENKESGWGFKLWSIKLYHPVFQVNSSTQTIYVFIANDLEENIGILDKWVEYYLNAAEAIKNGNLNQLASSKEIIFTGFSMSAGLAQIAACYYKNTAITFEGPGMKSIIAEIGCSEKNANITNYLTVPNRVNTLGEQIGAIKRIYISHVEKTSYWHRARAVFGEIDRISIFLMPITLIYSYWFLAAKKATTASLLRIDKAAEIVNFSKQNADKIFGAVITQAEIAHKNMCKARYLTEQVVKTAEVNVKLTRSFWTTYQVVANPAKAISNYQRKELIDKGQHSISRIMSALEKNENSPIARPMQDGYIIEMKTWPKMSKSRLSFFANALKGALKSALRSYLPFQPYNAGIKNINDENSYIEANVQLIEGYKPKR